MSSLTVEQQILVEGTAAQLYEQDAAYKARAAQPGSMLDEHVKLRWRDTARRKLKTGEIDGWFKAIGKNNHAEHHRHIRMASV